MADTQPLVQSDFELPPHTKQATKAIGLLLFFSTLMFSLPFGAFFGIRYLAEHYLHLEPYACTVWAVIASVLTVNLVIAGYAYIAYHEQEYDENGKPIDEKAEKTKSEKKKD